MFKFDIKLGWVTNTITNTGNREVPEVSETTQLIVPQATNSLNVSQETPANSYYDFLKHFWVHSETNSLDLMKQLEQKITQTQTEVTQLKEQVSQLTEQLQKAQKKISALEEVQALRAQIEVNNN